MASRYEEICIWRFGDHRAIGGCPGAQMPSCMIDRLTWGKFRAFLNDSISTSMRAEMACDDLAASDVIGSSLSEVMSPAVRGSDRSRSQRACCRGVSMGQIYDGSNI